jgi:8-oxo-dGTP pyrophosphatase MutT (NUDIX family)
VEDTEEVARLEVSEEVGGTADELRYFGQFFNSNGISNETAYVYLATRVACPDCSRSGNWAKPTASRRNPGPSLQRGLTEMRLVPVEEALRMARSAEISDGPSALARLRCDSLRRH